MSKLTYLFKVVLDDGSSGLKDTQSLQCNLSTGMGTLIYVRE